MNNKNIFASNLRKYLDQSGKSRREVCNALGLSYYTFSDWVNGKKYPRMDKVEMLANYFDIKKSDLIEKELTENDQQKNDTLADIILELRVDENFREIVETVHSFDAEKRSNVLTFVQYLKNQIQQG